MAASRFHRFQIGIQIAVGIVLLASLVQAFVFFGLVAPVYVAGSSMAPTLLGPAVVASCPQCDAQFLVGSEFVTKAKFAQCEHCENQRVPLDASRLHGATRILIDRTAFSRRDPRRGEVVVLQNPTDGSEWSVKRVAGLPGETVAIRQGDVWINGRPWVKSLAEQRITRCQIKPAGKVITDDVSFNAGLSRRSNPVRDFMASMDVQMVGQSQLIMELRAGLEHIKLTVKAPSGELTADVNGERLAVAMLSDWSRTRLGRGALVELSNFDRRLLLAVDSQVELTHALDVDAEPPVGSEWPFQLTTRGDGVQMGNLTLYRDVYYTRQAVDMAVGSEQVTLGPDEYYLLGDNSQVSVDSRSWGGVPRRFLVGKVLSVR